VKNKRLLAVLLVFLFVGGTLVASALVFRVQEINVVFGTGTTPLIADREQTEKSVERVVSDIAHRRNIIIGLNRTRITDAVENSDPQIRVTNIEARFPNRLRVTIRERFPMYVINNAILDYQLQIISFNTSLATNLINISDQFVLAENFNINAELGNNLKDFIEAYDCIARAEILVHMARLFFGQGYPEDEIVRLIHDVRFDSKVIYTRDPITNIIDDEDIVEFPGSMVIRLSDPSANPRFTNIHIEIHNFMYNFDAKLQMAWSVLEIGTQFQPGLITVFDDENLMPTWQPFRLGGA